MPSVYEYLEYREFLRDSYRERKKRDRYFSYRFIGGKIGLDAGYLVRVFQGRDHIPERCVGKTIRLLRLEKGEGDFFRALISFNKARTRTQVKNAFERVLQLRSIQRHTLDAFQYEFYKKWFYSAIRALIGLYDFDGSDYGELARALDPGLTEDEARSAVELLRKLNLVYRDKAGVYRVTDTMISTGTEWRTRAVREFQKETITLALRSLDEQEPDRRDISTVTFTASEDELEELRERIAEFRSSLLSLARESPHPDTVFQMNVQLFPMTRKKGRRS